MSTVLDTIMVRLTCQYYFVEGSPSANKRNIKELVIESHACFTLKGRPGSINREIEIPVVGHLGILPIRFIQDAVDLDGSFGFLDV